jgi:two-component system copper resistance phosphate regulon response regulator CusR
MRLLVMEDDAGLAGVIAQGLRESGHAVDVAGDGREGLELAGLEPYDLVVLDVMLPHMDGLEVCRRLRQAGTMVPVLFLTARDSVQDRVIGLDTGADDYLVKPFSLSELLARVRALLRRGPSTRPVTLQAGSVELDPGTRVVTRAGRVVELTNKELQILEFLLRNPDRVHSREEIAAHVWDYDFSATSNVLDVYVRSLRRKLQDEQEPRLIRTVRGAGYKLESQSQA